MSIFAERLTEMRKEKDLSQNELSKLIGVSVACINRWENDLRIPHIESLSMLCKFCECSADFLIGLED